MREVWVNQISLTNINTDFEVKSVIAIGVLFTDNNHHPYIQSTNIIEYALYALHRSIISAYLRAVISWHEVDHLYHTPL